LKSSASRIIKIIISAAAVANLLLLFIFDYTLPKDVAEVTGSARGLGTTISLPARFPAVTDLDLPNYGGKLIDSGSIRATDAEGTDITDRITFEAELDKNDERIAHCTFSVQGDEDKEPVSVTADVTVTLNRPVLVLSASSVTLALNAAFDPLDYVSEAVDASGISIIENTVIVGDIDTSVPGVYSIALQAKDESGYVSDPKTLTVTVS